MAIIKEGDLIGAGRRFGIVVSRFNEIITKELLEGALNHLRRSGVRETDLEVAWVPGSFEIPIALKEFAESRRFDGLIALGCIIRGETSNYQHIAQSTTDGIAQVMLSFQMPVGFGLLTVDSLEQAMARSGGKVGNKGREAAESALEMASLISKMRKEEQERAGAELLSKSIEEWPKVGN